MFMNEISSVKSLEYHLDHLKEIEFIEFPYFPGANNCLKDLLELNCSSDIYSEFFHQISQTCHNIQSLTINFGYNISNWWANLISLQNNLESLTLENYQCRNGIEIITFSLTKVYSTLTKLKI